jgi:hypothetical protein
VPYGSRCVQVVEMQYAADLADTLIDVRDVVESFRTWQLTVPDWDETLRQAAAALGRLPSQAQVGELLPGLLSNLSLLLTEGLSSVPQTVNEIAEQVAVVLEELRIPGIPTPEDDDWSFGEANAF